VSHTVIPSPKSTAATRELSHKGDVNYKTITERDREILDFNVTLFTGTITRCQHLVVDTYRIYVGRTRLHCQNIHQMIVTVNRTCVLRATEDMITQRINKHLVPTLHATLGVLELTRTDWMIDPYLFERTVEKTAGKWLKCESYFRASTPWLAAWAGHELGGSAPHQCR